MVSMRADLDGPVHYLDLGGDGPPLVCVHGLAGPALNWLAVAPAPAERHRPVAGVLRVCCADPSRVPADLVRALVEQEAGRLAGHRSHRALAQASRSLLWA